MRTAYEWFTEYLEICGSVSVGSLWQCPAHNDTFPSLSVNSSEDGRVLLKCFAGCEWEEVLQSLNLPMSVLFQPHLRSPQKLFEATLEKPIFAEFAWQSSSGKRKTGEWWDGHGYEAHISEEFHYYSTTVRMRRRRYANCSKQIIWQKLEGCKWVSRRGAVDLASLPLYRNQEVTFAKAAGRLIVLCESESSVDALEEAGIVATTWAGGAASFQRVALEHELAGEKVLYIADNDKAGLKCLESLEEFMPQITREWSVQVGLEGEDARDLLNRGALNFLRPKFHLNQNLLKKPF